MQVFHKTDNADKILKDGFQEGTGSYLTQNIYSGVWVSNVPLDINEGAKGETLLVIELPKQVFEEYEWKEEGKPYREALIPASILNQYGTPEVR